MGVHFIPLSVSFDENVVQGSAFKQKQSACFATFSVVLSFSAFDGIHAFKISSSKGNKWYGVPQQLVRIACFHFSV